MELLFDTALIERRRARAAVHQPPVDFLLKVVGEELAARLSVVERQFDEAVELHGGTGVAGAACLATGRIRHLQRYETFAHPDFPDTGFAGLEDVPMAHDSVKLVISPLVLQLVNDLPGVLLRIRRSLKPDGLFLAAISGAGTLAELRDSLLAADAELHGGASPRVIPFADIKALGGLAQRAGFTLPVVDVETYKVRYDNMFALMADLKAMGMANPLVGRQRKPVSKAFFLRAAEIYRERYSDPDGRIRASFPVVYLSGWAPHESQQKPLRPGSAKMRLAEALKPGNDAGG